jgi:hypothetical protein
MKKFLGFAAFVFILQGAGALLHGLTGGHFNLPMALLHRTGVLGDYGIYAGILLIVLGFAVGAASDAVKG